MKRLALAAAVIVLAALLAGPTSTGSVPQRPAGPATGVYACVTFNPATGLLETRYNVKIAPRGRYQYARFTRGGKLVDPTSGTYGAPAGRVVFKTGPMKSRFGKLSRTSGTPTISIFTKRPVRDTSVDCYRQ